MNRRHLYLLGRALLSSIFIISAIEKVTEWSRTVQTVSDKGLPLAPYFLAAAVAIELLGGLALLIGFRPRWSAALLFIYLIPVTLTMHNFWSAPGNEAQRQLVNFLKNLAIMGGLLTAASVNEDAVSARARTEEHREDIPLTYRAPDRARHEEHILHH